MINISIVIPARNEAENIGALVLAIDAVMVAHAPFEIIVVDDGSSDHTTDRVRGLGLAHVRLIRHPKTAGQSAAVHSGVQAARAPLICTLDGDGQNPPEELPKLIAPLLVKGSDRIGLVAGRRVNRQDTWSKKIASKLANRLRGWLLRDDSRDSGCGLKAFRREPFLALPYFDHMHRYLPALFARDGWQVAHIDVSHKQRVAGLSNYSNTQRALVGAVDLLGVAWLLRRRKKAQPLAEESDGSLS